RIAAHTNADDAARYREDDEVRAWLERDPITRLESYLTRRKVLTAQRARAASEQADRVASLMRDGLSRDLPADPADLFAHVYASPIPLLTEQAAMVADELDREGGD